MGLKREKSVPFYKSYGKTGRFRFKRDARGHPKAQLHTDGYDNAVARQSISGTPNRAGSGGPRPERGGSAAHVRHPLPREHPRDIT